MQGPPIRAAILALAVGASLATVVTLPAAASAQSYDDYRAYQDCRAQQSGNAVGGAIVGGVIGGVLGNSLAGRHDRGADTAVGAGLGAAVGAGVGSSSTNCAPGYDYRRDGYDNGYYDRGDRAYPGYYQTDPDYPTGPYGGDGY